MLYNTLYESQYNSTRFNSEDELGNIFWELEYNTTMIFSNVLFEEDGEGIFAKVKRIITKFFDRIKDWFDRTLKKIKGNNTTAEQLWDIFVKYKKDYADEEIHLFHYDSNKMNTCIKNFRKASSVSERFANDYITKLKDHIDGKIDYQDVLNLSKTVDQTVFEEITGSKKWDNTSDDPNSLFYQIDKFIEYSDNDTSTIGKADLSKVKSYFVRDRIDLEAIKKFKGIVNDIQKKINDRINEVNKLITQNENKINGDTDKIYGRFVNFAEAATRIGSRIINEFATVDSYYWKLVENCVNKSEKAKKEKQSKGIIIMPTFY